MAAAADDGGTNAASPGSCDAGPNDEQELLEAFATFDTEQNGHITAEQLKTALTTMGLEPMGEEEVRLAPVAEPERCALRAPRDSASCLSRCPTTLPATHGDCLLVLATLPNPNNPCCVLANLVGSSCPNLAFPSFSLAGGRVGRVGGPGAGRAHQLRSLDQANHAASR